MNNKHSHVQGINVCITLLCGYKSLVKISVDLYIFIICGNKKCFKFMKNALCFIMGYLVSMETYVTLNLIDARYARYIDLV